MQFHWIVLDGIVLLALLVWVYRRRALKGVTYARHFSRTVAYEGDTIEMVERIANRKLLPVPWLRLESLMPRALVFGQQAGLDIRSGERFQNHQSLFSLRPYRQITRRHRVLCAKRGWYRLQSATMTAGDPLGLATVVRRFPLELELLVYPRGVPLRELPLPSHSWLGDIAVRRWIAEDPFLVAGVREYRSGDPLRAVNWNATARTGTLQVHKRDYTADHRLMICLNLEVTETMWNVVTDPDRIEQGIRYAASALEYAIGLGLAAGFLCNGWVAGQEKRPVRAEPETGSLQAARLLETMAKLQLELSANMAWLLEQEAEAGAQDADYLIVTCHTDEKLRKAADRLKRQGNGVEWMLIPPSPSPASAPEPGRAGA
jgi:uncharacterized protein (DUF58 family)